MIRKNGDHFAAILLLAFMAVVSFGAARRESATFDEFAHIGAGLSYVQKLDLRLNPEHPPLSKVISGAVLAARGVRADYTGPAWQYSKDFLPAFFGEWSFGQWVVSRWNNSATVLFWARLPMLGMTLALGWLIFIFGKRLGGSWGGLICLTVYVSAPLFIVFGPLVLTDIPIALFSVMTIWTFGNLWRNPERRTIMTFSLCLAGAFLSKFSAAILLLGVLTSAQTTRWMPLGNQPTGGADLKAWRRARWRGTGKALLGAALIVYAFYFIFSWNQPTDGLARIGGSLPALILRRLLLPPAAYLGGMFLVLFTFSRSTFLLGQSYPKGTWFYFPIVFALKSQLGFLGLLVLAGALSLARVRKRVLATPIIPMELRMHWRALWVTLMVFTVVCILSHFDISVRHFSVPAALLILMLAPLPRMLQSIRGRSMILFRAGASVAGALALSCLFTTGRAYPWYLPYVNALGGGRPAYRLMADSNIDWDQALPQVEEFAERHRLKDVALDSYGTFDDTLFVPQSHPWDCQSPTASDAGQWVVVSANMLVASANCSWLTEYEYEELAGGSMYAFHLPPMIPADGTAGGPPRPADRRTFLDMPFDFKALSLELSRHPEKIPEGVKLAQQASAAGRK